MRERLFANRVSQAAGFCRKRQPNKVYVRDVMTVNQPLRIAVVDDLAQDRERLCEQLARYASAHGFDWQVSAFESGEAFLRQADGFALVFLDVVLGGINGIETARRLRAANPWALLVLVTVEADFALDGYEVEAAGFLLKGDPQGEARFESLMKRLLRRMLPEAELDFPAGGLRVPVSAVTYVEVLNHNMLVHTDHAVHTLRMTLQDFKRALPEDNRFFECHRGVTVNLDAISALRDDVVMMRDGDVLPVSRRRRAALEKAYMQRSIARLREVWP